MANVALGMNSTRFTTLCHERAALLNGGKASHEPRFIVDNEYVSIPSLCLADHYSVPTSDRKASSSSALPVRVKNHHLAIAVTTW